MNKIVHRTVLAATIVFQGRVLIVKRAAGEKLLPGVWEIPGGKKKAFESTRKGLLREIEEETGLTKLKVGQPLSVFEYAVPKDTGYRDTVQVNFFAELEEDQPVVLSAEHQESAWVKLDELGKYKMTDQIRVVLKETFKKI